MTPSFMSYDIRGKKRGRIIHLLKWLALFLLGATLLNSLIPVSSAQEKEPLQDDAFICSHVHEYPIAQHKAILEYCVGLMERGL